MDSRRNDSAPAGSSDASGTLFRAAHDDSGSARETASAADPTTAARSPTFTIYKVPTETARLRQDVFFRVGARLSKIKREELEIASPAVDGMFSGSYELLKNTSKKFDQTQRRRR
jgi:hypothetical protein